MNVEELKKILEGIDDDVEVEYEYYDGGSKWLYYAIEANIEINGNGKEVLVIGGICK